MIYAARTAKGHWTGAAYDAVTPAIRAHHAQYDEVLVAVAALTNTGDDTDPVWEAEEITAEARRATMVVSRFQARAALHGAGLLDRVEAALAEADPLARIAWADAQEFRRLSPTMTTLGAALGLTDTQIDALFDQAALIAA